MSHSTPPPRLARTAFGLPAPWALAFALASPAAAQAEAPLYVIANHGTFDQGLGQIVGYRDGGTPAFTYLMDFTAAPQGQVPTAQGLAWDSSSGRPVVCSFDGFRESFLAVDLATQTTPLVFEDDYPVQMQGFALGPSGVGYGQHVVTSEVLKIDLELQSVEVAGDFGCSSGSALAISPGGLVYALCADTGLRCFDPVTAQATFIGDTFLWGAAGMDFTEDGRLFVLLYGGQLFELNPATAAIEQVSFVAGLGLGSGSYGLTGMCIAARRPFDWGTLCGDNDVGLLPVGSGRVSGNDLRLAAHGLPGSVFAMAVVSDGSRPPVTSTQFSGGLCLAVGALRLRDTIQLTEPGGTLMLDIDLSTAPALGGTTPVAPGDARYFQIWYRNQQAMGFAEFTSAVEVTFQ